MKLLLSLTKNLHICRQLCSSICLEKKPKHLICFKQWTTDMVMNIINSAINLKKKVPDTHGVKLDLLSGYKVMVLQEVNEPILNLAVSKAATMLGCNDVTITDHVVWGHDYNGKIFSLMSDLIFVSTSTHMCVQRLADKSTVPVMCMRSRTHGSLQSLATVMAIIEELGTMKCVNVAYLGPPHPVLNSYLLLCPMLEANIKFKCCCDVAPVTPLLQKASEELGAKMHTISKPCTNKKDTLTDAHVIIAGPTTLKKDKLKFFAMDICMLDESAQEGWVFIHTCPRGAEVDDALFYHEKARTFTVFQNMQYIAAALLADAVRDHTFKCD